MSAEQVQDYVLKAQAWMLRASELLEACKLVVGPKSRLIVDELLEAAPVIESGPNAN